MFRGGLRKKSNGLNTPFQQPRYDLHEPASVVGSGKNQPCKIVALRILLRS